MLEVTIITVVHRSVVLGRIFFFFFSWRRTQMDNEVAPPVLPSKNT